MNRNYVDDLARRIADACGMDHEDPDGHTLLRLYALLGLTRGELVTSEDVHDAWSAWCSGVDPSHRSLIRFEDLAPGIQQLDDKYRDAIRRVTGEGN